MAIWLNQLKSKGIVTQDEGEKAGSISESYFEIKSKRVIGFMVKTRGINGKEKWLAVEQVKKIGKDVIFIQKNSALLEEPPSGTRLSDFLGKPVTSKDGRSLGKLTDVGINPQNYEVVELAVNSDQKMQAVLNELVLGADSVLVQTDAKLENIPEPAQDEDTVISEISDLISRHAAGMVRQGEDLVKKTSETIKRMLAGPDEKKDQEKENKADDSGA